MHADMRALSTNPLANYPYLHAGIHKLRDLEWRQLADSYSVRQPNPNLNSGSPMSLKAWSGRIFTPVLWALGFLGFQGENEVPMYDHKTRQPISPGDVAPLLIPIWPVGMVFEAGGGLMLRISGHDMSYPEVEATEPVDDNKGKHMVHTGGQCDSYLVILIITE